MVVVSSATEPRLPLAFRVGVTGSRSISAERISTLRVQTEAILRRIRQEIDGLAMDARLKVVYEQYPEGPLSVERRLVSPLAEGADRLAAEEAQKLGYRLVAPLPFDRGEYEKDFPESVEAFRRLASKAQVIEMDGGRGGSEPASYEAVGRFVVRNCDLLIALWDGNMEGAGRGGTAEIVQFAARSHVPIWWIDVRGAEPKLIANLTHWRRLSDAFNGAKADVAVKEYLAKIILPPAAPHLDRPGVMGRAAHQFCVAIDYNPSPSAVYVLEKAPAPSTGIWLAYQILLGALAPQPIAETAAIETPLTPIEKWWDSHYRRADALSIAYGDRYRSSYVVIIGLAFLTVLVSAVGALVTAPVVSTSIDVLLLLGISALVWENHVRGWQERWITYRLLAELCRKQMILSPLGRTLPGTEINRTVEEAAVDHTDMTLPREAWVGWYFLAALRSAPAPVATVAGAKQRAFALGRSLVVEQANYHRLRRTRTKKADHRLAEFGELAFLSTLLVLIVRLVLLASGASAGWADVLAALFSAASAAFVGLRAYSEFALLARQSLRMQEIMAEFTAELDSIDLSLPLASQELGATLHRLAMSMMLEVRGWAQLFRLKAVETG